MRSLIVLTAVLGMALPGLAAADDFGAVAVAPAAQSFKLGALTLIAVRDAQFVLHNDAKTFGVDAGPDAVAAVLKSAGLPDDRITLSVDALVVRNGKHVVLLDSGLGAKSHGVLVASLKAAGLAPTDVTDVLITHSHGDHVGGLVDAAGAGAFPHATIRMTTAEWTWMRSKPESDELVKAIKDRVRTFSPGATVVPGITARALEGHTPGHVGYEITSGKQRLFDLGDLAHSSLLSLARPEWTVGFDSDATHAKATRRAVLGQLAHDGEWVFAPHFPFPGVGHVIADGDAFRWSPGTP